jgi:hypothetical protein
MEPQPQGHVCLVHSVILQVAHSRCSGKTSEMKDCMDKSVKTGTNKTHGGSEEPGLSV